MSDTKDGKSQAYPSNWGPGVTVRDYFAAKALQGLLANPTMNPDGDFDSDAELSYSWADAMLRAREVKQ